MDHSSKFSTHSHLCSFTNQFSHGLNHGRKCWLHSFMPQNSVNLKPSSRGKGIDSTHGYPWKLHDHELVKCLAAHFWWVASQEDWAAWSCIGSPALTVERCWYARVLKHHWFLMNPIPSPSQDHQILQKGIFIYEKLLLLLYCFWKIATAMVPFQNSVGIIPISRKRVLDMLLKVTCVVSTSTTRNVQNLNWMSQNFCLMFVFNITCVYLHIHDEYIWVRSIKSTQNCIEVTCVYAHPPQMHFETEKIQIVQKPSCVVEITCV